MMGRTLGSPVLLSKGRNTFSDKGLLGAGMAPVTFRLLPMGSRQLCWLGVVWWSHLQSVFNSLLSQTSFVTLSKFLNSSEPVSSPRKQD